MRAAQALLWVLVTVAAVAGPVALLARHPSTGMTSTPASRVAPPTVTAFAQLFVAAYLDAGDQDGAMLARFLGETPDLRGAKRASTSMRLTAVVAADQVSDRYWSVTVAATITEAPGGGGGVMRFFSVGVLDGPEGPVVTDLPAEVAGPPTARRPALAGPIPSAVVRGEPLVDTAVQFLTAYLLGDSSLGRYVALDSVLADVGPVPYGQVDVERVAVVRRSEGGAWVRAQVRATARDGAVRLLRYQIELIERDRRWEVVAVSGAPLLARAPAGRTPAPPRPAERPLYDPLPDETDHYTDTDKGEPTQ